MNNSKIVEKLNLTEADVDEVKERGISLDGISKQVGLIKGGTNHIKLDRPCTIDDGIRKVDYYNTEELLNLHKRVARQNRFMKFVPASGAASRMFKKLETILNLKEVVTFNSIQERKDESEEFDFAFEFFSNLPKFAFYSDLKSVMMKDNHNMNEILDKGDLRIVLRYLLKVDGLNYSNKSKALLKFHEYINGSRTALEEQVIEGIAYASSDKKVNYHFTAPPEQIEDFIHLKDELSNKYAAQNLNIDYSFQKKSTDTIALDNDGNIFRTDGKMLFRPGGHGALIQNLNDIDDDIIFIKNIDNVQKEHLLEKNSYYKKILAGILIKYQSEIFDSLEKIESDNLSSQELKQVEKFAVNDLSLSLDEKYKSASLEEKKEYLVSLLNRPIRVCGMVKNEGHPGGGPFWIRDEDGSLSRQIIEEAQVDQTDKNQREIFKSSTHFNPVDIVAGVRNFRGDKFDLTNYVNDKAVFVADKSKDGKELKALELPGLWNGAMHHWLTLFVEVPNSTFTPVKEVNDLLKDEHQ